MQNVIIYVFLIRKISDYIENNWYKDKIKIILIIIGSEAFVK